MCQLLVLFKVYRKLPGSLSISTVVSSAWINSFVRSSCLSSSKRGFNNEAPYYEAQEVVPLEIIDDVEVSSNNKPAIVLNIQAYRIEISNHVAKETISNTLSVLQQLC